MYAGVIIYNNSLCSRGKNLEFNIIFSPKKFIYFPQSRELNLLKSIWGDF